MSNKIIHKCNKCIQNKSSFFCKTCNKPICLTCVYVTVVHGKWNFYCSTSCAPYLVDSYNKKIEETKAS